MTGPGFDCWKAQVPSNFESPAQMKSCAAYTRRCRAPARMLEPTLPLTMLGRTVVSTTSFACHGINLQSPANNPSQAFQNHLSDKPAPSTWLSLAVTLNISCTCEAESIHALLLPSSSLC